jgi:hypothetical protein
MFRVTEFRIRKPRTFGAVYLGLAALVYVLAFAITNSSSYKAHQDDFQSSYLPTYLPLGLTFLSSAWGVMAILYVLLGSKLNQLNSWMRAAFDVELSGKSIGRIGTCLRGAVTFVFAIAYAVIIFPLTFILYRALLHLRLS